MSMAQVSDSLAAGLAQNIQPTFGYYRQPNGWLTVSPNTRLERLKYTEQGWTYLTQYGAFDMTTYTANHPFEGLFMFGGAGEMPADQVLQMGFHISPPLIPTCQQHITQYHRGHTQVCWRGAKAAEFPQLAGISAEQLGPFPCDFCGRKMPTSAARTQHQSVAHAKPLDNVQLGRSLGESIAAALGKGSGLSTDEQAELAELRKEAAARKAVKQPKSAVSG